MSNVKDDAPTVIRAVTLPVAVPLGAAPDGRPWTWGTFDAAFAPALRLATDLANWCVRRLFVLDDPAGAKTPDAVKKWYGYGDAAKNFPAWSAWAGAAASAQCVIRAVQRKYVQQRFDVIVRQRSSLLTYRYPQPFPVHNQNWRTDYAAGGFPVVRVNIPGVGAVELRLKRDAGFRRQLALFRQLHEGTAKRGEAALYRDRKGQLLVKLVGHFPRRERADAPNACFLHTDPSALLVAEVNGRSVAVTNGDHLRRAHAVIRGLADRHRRFLQRVGEDRKREARMDRRQRANLDRTVEARCAKQRARVDTAVKQIAAQVARFCERQRVGLVAYDDAAKGFLTDGFPWHALKARLRQLVEGEMGCDWIDDSAPAFGAGFNRLTDQKERDAWLLRARATALAGARAVAHRRRSGSHPAVTPNSPPTPCPRPKSRRGSARR